MQDLKGKVAVITGGADGISKATAVAAATEGMKLVLADIDADKLNNTVEELAGTGAEVIGLRTDVSSESSVQAPNRRRFRAFRQCPSADQQCRRGIGQIGVKPPRKTGNG